MRGRRYQLGAANPKRDRSYRISENHNLSFQYRVWPKQLGTGVPAFLFAVVETNLTTQGRSEIARLSDPDSGGTRWDIDFGLQYVTANYILEGILQIPTVDRPNGLRNDFRFTTGLRWNVSLPF